MSLYDVRIKSSAALLVAWCSAACGTYIGNPDKDKTASTRTPENSHQVSLSLGASPSDTVKALFLQISSLSLTNRSGAQVSLALSDSAPIDLLALQDGNVKMLVNGSLIDPDQYSSVTLEISPDFTPYVIKQDDTKQPLPASSATKLSMALADQGTWSSNQHTELFVDFDIRRSLVMEGGNFVLKPLLRAADAAFSTDLSGDGLEDNSIVCVYASLSDVKDTDDTCFHALASTKVHGGKYQIKNLAEGNYAIRLFPPHNGKPIDSITKTAEVSAARKDKSNPSTADKPSSSNNGKKPEN